MPIEFLCSRDELSRHSPPPFTEISSKRIAKLGSLRNRRGFNGIASLRVLNNLTQIKYEELCVSQSGLKLKTWIPEWWPQNVNKIYFPEKDYYENMFNIIPV